MFCYKCGSEIIEGSAFCSRCGAKQGGGKKRKGGIIALALVISAVLLIAVGAGCILYFSRDDQASQKNRGLSFFQEINVENPFDWKELLSLSMEAAHQSGSAAETQLFEQFLNNELPLMNDWAEDIYFNDLMDDWDGNPEYVDIAYLDLDNDGKDELVLNGLSYYGSIVVDVKEDGVYILAEGNGTAEFCSYTVVEGEAWIVHSDTSHMGRQIYDFCKYNGNGEVTDQFVLSAEYWDEPDDTYHEDSEFSYRGEKITMQDYENLLAYYFG